MSIMVGIIIIVCSGLTTHLLSKKYKDFFVRGRKGEKEEENEEEPS